APTRRRSPQASPAVTAARSVPPTPARPTQSAPPPAPARRPSASARAQNQIFRASRTSFFTRADRLLPFLHLRQPVRVLAHDILVAVAPLAGHLVEGRIAARIHRVFRIAELVQSLLLDHLVNPLFLLLI